MPDSVAPKGVIAGLVLAGGLSRRMEGRDKVLIEIGGKPLIGHVCSRLGRQVQPVAINANGDSERFGFLGHAVIADTIQGFAGPLAGVLAGLEWAGKLQEENADESAAILTVAGDTPFFPDDLAARLIAAREAAGQPWRTISMAFSSGRAHPTFAVWPLELAPALRHYLVEEEGRRMIGFAERHNLVPVHFETSGNGSDPFFNINTPEDMESARTRLEGY